MSPKPAKELEKPISENATETDRIVFRQRIERQRVGPAEGQLAEGGVADADIALRIHPRAVAARIEVRGLIGILVGRMQIVVGERPRRVEEHARIGIDARFQKANERPAAEAERTQILLHLDADDRRAQAVIGREPLRPVAALLDAVIELVGAGIEGRAPALVADADIERAIDRNAVGTDRTIVRRRIEPIPEAPPAIRLGPGSTVFLVGRSAAWATPARPAAARRTKPNRFITAPKIELIKSSY